MPDPLSREHALRVLAVASTAGVDEIKRAYRRLARQHHPDLGGDPEVFHELHQAFERLLADDTAPTTPTMARGRPSRPPRPFGDEADTADLGSIDWSVSRPTAGTRLDRHRLAAALLGNEGDGIDVVTATSRAPGSRLNPLALHLAGNLTSALSIRPDRDDRGGPVVAIEIRARGRRSRRALEAATLFGRWTRLRGSSSTLLRSGVAPGRQRRTTIVQIADRIDELLDDLGWGLTSWTLTDGHD